MPQRRALGAGWRVAALVDLARIAKPHGHQREVVGVVERVFIDAQPLAQTVARIVVPRYAGFVNDGARRLADDQDAGLDTGADDGSWAERQMRLALAAGVDVPQQGSESANLGHAWMFRKNGTCCNPRALKGCRPEHWSARPRIVAGMW